MLLAITTGTWIVTGLGFGIVLLLLFFLVYVMKFFGWVMQLIERKVKKQESGVKSQDDTAAAIATALYLASEAGHHDQPTAIIAAQARETAWNEKANGLNNMGF